MAQKCDDGKYIARVKAPAGQFAIFDVKEVSTQEETAPLWKWDGHCLESALLRIVFEKDGTLSSIMIKKKNVKYYQVQVIVWKHMKTDHISMMHGKSVRIIVKRVMMAAV